MPHARGTFQPFPLEVLPAVLSEFCLAQARSICCDPTLILLPALAVMATAIGNSRRVLLRESWSEPAILWTACVADSGSGKSPAFAAARRPLDKLQLETHNQHQQLMAEYERWLSGSCEDPTAAEKFRGFQPPSRQDVFLEETAMEAIATALDQRPRGSGMLCEELNEWFLRLSHVNWRRIEEAFYMQVYEGRSAKLFRVSGTKRRVDSAVLSISGTIGQAGLKQLLNEGRVSGGILARILFAMPPEQRRKWSDEDVPAEVTERFEQMVFRLSAAPATGGSCASASAATGGSFGAAAPSTERTSGERSKLRSSKAATASKKGTSRRRSQPSASDVAAGGSSPESSTVYLSLTPAARDRFKRFYDEVGDARCDVEGDRAKAVWSKIEGVAARIALIVSCARYATGETDQEVVDEPDIVAGTLAARWFANEAERIERALKETPEMSEQRCLSDWIRLQGGSIGLSELRLRRYKYRYGDSAEQALESLVASGFGNWGPTETTPHGGRPTRRFVSAAATGG